MNELVWWIAQNAITVVLLVPVVWVVCRLRRSHPAEQHLLWLLLLVKLVTPPFVLWPWSAADIREWAIDARDQSFIDRPVISVDPITSAIPARDVGTVYTASDLPSDGLETAVSDSHPISTTDPAERPAIPIPEVSVAKERSDLFPRGWPILVGLWIAGAVIVSLRMGSQLRVQWRLVRAAQKSPAELQSLVEEVASSLKLRRARACVSSQTNTPFVSCLGGPVLVWPASLTGPESIASCRGVVAHELAHLRRRDHWVAWLEALTAPLWWWNPIYWFLRRRLDETRELACDALALELTATDRRTFAELLLEFSASGRPALPFAPLRTGIAPRHSLKRRLAMLFDKRVSGRVSSAGLILTGLLATATLPGWAWGQEEPAEPAPAAAALEATEIESQTPVAAPAATTTAEPAAATTPARAAAPAATTAAPVILSDDGYSPPPAADPGAVGAMRRLALANSGSSAQEFDVDGDTMIRLRPAADGKGVILLIIERGEPAGEVTLPGVTLQGEPLTPPTAAPAKTYPAGARRRMPGEGNPGARGGTGGGMADQDGTAGMYDEMMLGDDGSMPSAAQRSTPEIRLLKNALELAELEVEEKKILLEQGQLKNQQVQNLAERGAITSAEVATSQHALQLLKIDLRKAELQVDQARIRLETATK